MTCASRGNGDASTASRSSMIGAERMSLVADGLMRLWGSGAARRVTYREQMRQCLKI